MKRREFLGLAALTTVLAATTDADAWQGRCRTKKWTIGFSQVHHHRAVARSSTRTSLPKPPSIRTSISSSPTARTRPEAGSRRRKPDPPAGRRAFDLAEGIGRPHRRRAEGDRGQDRSSCSTRNVETKDFTRFVGGDNKLIGRAANMRSNCSAARARPPAMSSRSGAAWAPKSPRMTAMAASTNSPTRAGHQMPARQAVGRLETGSGLQHHGHRPAQQRGRSTWSTA